MNFNDFRQYIDDIYVFNFSVTPKYSAGTCSVAPAPASVPAKALSGYHGRFKLTGEQATFVVGLPQGLNEPVWVMVGAVNCTAERTKWALRVWADDQNEPVGTSGESLFNFNAVFAKGWSQDKVLSLTEGVYLHPGKSYKMTIYSEGPIEDCMVLSSAGHDQIVRLHLG